MINTTGGIDKLIEQKADAYRGNPQALQKRYSQNQELMDLLAMQKLKSEKETAARDMALKAEQTPSTIAEQYEQQLVSMNKNEMANQVAGVLGQKQKRAQQRQQAMGIAPQQRPQQRPQGAPQGIANQPRPNMQGMAQGGIVGYQEGGKLSRLEQALKALGISYKDYRAMRPEQKKVIDAQIEQEYVKQREEFTDAGVPEMPIVKTVREAQDPEIQAEKREAIRRRLNPTEEEKMQDAKAAGIQGGLSSAQSSALQSAMTGAPAPSTSPATGIATTAPVGADTVLAPAPVGTTPSATAPATGGLAATGQGMSVDDQLAAALATAAPDTSGISKTQLTEALGDKFIGKLEGRMDVDPEEKKKEEITRLAADDAAKGGYGVEKYQEGLAKYLQQKEELDKEMLAPEAVAKRRRAAGLEGLMVGGTSGSAAAARGRFDRDLAASRQGSIAQQRDMYVKNETEKNKVIKDINTDAAKAFEVYTNDVAAAMNTMANISEADLTLASKEADRMYETNQNGIKNKIDAIRVSGEAKLRELVQNQASLQDIASSIEGLVGKSNDLREEHFKALQPEMQRLNNIIETSDPVKDADEIKAARAQLVSMEATFMGLKDKTKLDELIEIYEDFLMQLKSQGGYTNQLTTSLQQKMQSTLGGTSTTKTGGTSGQTSQKAQSYLGQVTP